MSRSIFITGGTSGLGLELAKHYITAACNVAVCSFQDFEEVKDVLPKNTTYYQADVCDTQKMSDIIYDFYHKTGALDIVIANAGISMPKAKIPDFDLGRKVIDINIKGVLNTFEPSIKIMQEQGSGHIAALSSIAGTIGGLPGMAIYGASKSAVFTLCESLEIDLKKYGIQVTALCPGFIATPLTQKNSHSQPFLLSSEKAGKMIFKTLENKKGLYLFPLPMAMTASLLRRMPRKAYKWIMQKDFLNTGSH